AGMGRPPCAGPPLCHRPVGADSEDRTARRQGRIAKLRRTAVTTTSAEYSHAFHLQDTQSAVLRGRFHIDQRRCRPRGAQGAVQANARTCRGLPRLSRYRGGTKSRRVRGRGRLLERSRLYLVFARNPEHRIAKRKGRDIWYSHYLIRICKVERDYGRPEERRARRASEV